MRSCSSRRATSGPSALGEPVHATLPLLLGVELVRADVAKTVLGRELGVVPCGGPITWALLIDGVVRGRTDEPMTDDAAQRWARRIVGDGACFQLAHPAGGYWLTESRSGWSR